MAAEASKGDRTVDLSVGTIRYTDTGGSGPVLVFAHGLLMDGSVWRPGVPRRAAERAVELIGEA